VADLVSHCGVSERTLRKHFRAFMGVSPLDYWRRLRLAAAREALLKGADGSSITEVAARFGFTHFGRFSQLYRRRFGETPSATLQRSRLDRRRATARAGRENPDSRGSVAVIARTSRERPSVAVLPCQVSASEPDCRFFGEYLSEGIATALCRTSSLSVVVPRSTQNVELDLKRFSRKLSARYLVSGRIAQSRKRVRVIIRLLEAATGFSRVGRHL
jgi:TolB-like protein